MQEAATFSYLLLNITSDILEGFENVRSISLCELNHFALPDMACRLRQRSFLCTLFAELMDALVPVRETIGLLRFSLDGYSEDFSYYGIPDLSGFPNIKTFGIPQSVLVTPAWFQLQDSAHWTRPVESGTASSYAFTSTFLDMLPPHLQSLTIHQCESRVLVFLRALIDFEDRVPHLRQVEMHFVWAWSRNHVGSYIDDNGVLMGVKNSKIKLITAPVDGKVHHR